MEHQSPPLRVRRVVTGHDGAGHAVIVSDGIAPRFHDFDAIPGMSETLVWSTEPAATIPRAAADPTPSVSSLVPHPGGTGLSIVRFPPDSVFADPGFDPAAAAAEQVRVQPGLADCFEPDHPGMHTTDTVDYGLVLEGEITLELDDGLTVELKRGDVVVQNGTRHAWRNPGPGPATLAFFNLGAERPTP